MGLLGKIALKFDGARFGVSADTWVGYPADGMERCGFLCWPLDQDVMIGFVGGRFAWDLTAGDAAAAVDFGLGEARRLFGSAVDRNFVDGLFTRWGDDPWSLGAYSAALPGKAHQRTALAQPLGDRVFFAGEAVAGPFRSTCSGAAVSGLSVADRVAGQVL